MKTTSRLVVNIVPLLALLAGLIVGCSAPSQPIKVDLSFSDPPALNRPVKVTATFTLIRSYLEQGAKNVTAQIILPAGFHKVDGDLSWNGSLVWGTTQTLTATVRAGDTGTWKLEARAEYDVAGSHAGGSKTVYVTVSEQGATVSDRPPDSGTFARPVQVPSPSPAASVDLSFSDSPALNKPVKVTATFALTASYPVKEAQNVTAQIILPPGFQRIDGELSWNGTLDRGTTQTLNVTVKAVNTGTWEVVARADEGREGRQVIGLKVKYVTVSENGATISDSPPGVSAPNLSTQPTRPPNPEASTSGTIPCAKSQLSC